MAQRWRLAALSFTSYAPLGAIFPYLALELGGRGVPLLGLVLAIPALMSLFVGPLWGMLADWLQSWRGVLIAATILATLGVGVLWGAPAAYCLIAMAMYAFGRAPIAPIIDAMILEGLGDQKSLYGKVRLWGSLGYMAGANAISWLKSSAVAAPFDSGLILGFGLMLVLLLLLWTMPPPQQVERPNMRQGLSKLIGNRALQWVLLCSGMHFSMHMANSTFIANHVNALGLDPLWVGAAISGGILVEVVIFASGEHWLKRFGASRLFCIAAFLAAARWAGMSVSEEGWQVLLMQSSHGVTFGLFWLGAVRLVTQLSPASLPATGQGLLSAAVGGVGAAGGVFIGQQLVANYDTVMLYQVAAFVALLTGVLSLRLRHEL